MRALLSAVGTRGDVQPIVAVAHAVRALGHEARLCVPPNFVDSVRAAGFEAFPVGVEMRARDPAAPPLTAAELERLRASMPDLITDQFDAVGAAAEGCDVILGANAHQYAAPSIAALRRVPYFCALYAPVAIPSPDHPPPPAPGAAWAPSDPAAHLALWAESRRAWNARALERVNHNRDKRGLAPIDDVLLHNITDHPWLATDAVLAPVPATATTGMTVRATGAWILDDDAPLPPALDAFLHAGDAPIYFGFGSMPAPKELGRTLVDAARAVGRRAIVSQGWAALDAADAADCIVIGDVNHRALFPRVAAVVHHGGAGTTAAVARAAVPHVVTPLFSDQFYWAGRVRALGIGTSTTGPLTVDALSVELRAAVSPDVAERARALAPSLRADGAHVAARALFAGA